jgi:hypothetical protein
MEGMENSGSISPSSKADRLDTQHAARVASNILGKDLIIIRIPFYSLIETITYEN